MLKIDNISKTFNKGTINEKLALDGLSITINDGDFITVIGGNGAGKSTLLNAICGTIIVDNGSIVLDGKEITKLGEAKRAKYLGRVFQDPMMGTCADMSVEENLALAIRRGKTRSLKWGMPKKDREDFVGALAKLDLGLEERLSSKVGLLSGGQRQAITLLMATLNRPELLLLDEHTAALDPKTAEKVLYLTKQIVEDGNITTLMITHNMQDAITYGNRLIMMNAGKIIYDVSGEEKKSLTVKALLEKFEQIAPSVVASDKMVLATAKEDNPDEVSEG
ncbi:MAG: ABC transporter ATP-binding protein [Clostridia bacterium]|nr:ABC transporter ATP-binding protein [Clostridia bacterium]